MTIVHDLDELHTELAGHRRAFEKEPAKRELSLAITHIEDAIMRVNRAFAMENGMFRVSDVEAEIAQSGS